MGNHLRGISGTNGPLTARWCVLTQHLGVRKPPVTLDSLDSLSSCLSSRRVWALQCLIVTLKHLLLTSKPKEAFSGKQKCEQFSTIIFLYTITFAQLKKVPIILQCTSNFLLTISHFFHSWESLFYPTSSSQGRMSVIQLDEIVHLPLFLHLK